MKTIRWHAVPRHSRAINNPNVLHVEADGCIVNVEVGLTDARGRKVTRVDVLPDDERRGGDINGRTWRLVGSRSARVVQLKGRAKP